jgi:hypothetical protein
MSAGQERLRQREAEFWMRRAGLPYFVRLRDQANNLPARVAPFVVFLLTLSFLADVVIDIDLPAGSTALADVLLAVVGVVIVLIALLAPVAVGILSARILRRWPRLSLPVGIAAMLAYVVAFPLLSSIAHLGETVGESILANAVIVLSACLLTALGLGSLLSWAARQALGGFAALGGLATRALPLLLLVVLFAFFARPLWDVTSAMSALRLLFVVLFFVALGLLFAIPVTRHELKALEQGSPGSSGAASGPPLSALERFNLGVVMVLAQGFQVMIVALLVCTFLLLLGVLAFSPEVLTLWLGTPPATVHVLGIELPLNVALVKTAVFLSCVSSLNFLVSLATGSAYRSAFYEPMLADARIALNRRAEYRRSRAIPERSAPETGGTNGTGSRQAPDGT